MNNKKKIVFLVTQSEFGGAQRFIYNLIQGLMQDEIRIDVMVAAGIEGDNENGLLFNLEKQGIKTRRLKYLRRAVNPFFDFGLGLIEIYRFIKKEKPDILFLCSSKAGAMGSLIGRLCGIKKIIYRIGGWTFNDPWPNWRKKLWIWLEKTSAKWKDIIINNAKSDTEQAIKLRINPKDKIVTIYNGIDVNKLEFLSREEARKFLDLKDSDFVIGTIANDYPTKGIKYLNRAAKDFKNIKLIIIGKGNRFIPEAYKYIKAFDIFVLPSLKEGLPWVILESMAAEVPVIATKVGAVPEIINSEKNGILIESGSAEKLAAAIKKLSNNKDLRDELVKEAKKTIIEKFSLEKMVKEIKKLF